MIGPDTTSLMMYVCNISQKSTVQDTLPRHQHAAIRGRASPLHVVNAPVHRESRHARQLVHLSNKKNTNVPNYNSTADNTYAPS